MRLREYLGDIFPKPLLSMKSAALGVDRTSSGVFTSAGVLSWVLQGGTPFICRPTRLYVHLEWTCKTSTNPALGILTTCFLRRHIHPYPGSWLDCYRYGVVHPFVKSTAPPDEHDHAGPSTRNPDIASAGLSIQGRIPTVHVLQ